MIWFCRPHGDIAGHLGVRKTYDRIVCDFFWPWLKRDVSVFIKLCQLTGKPNQTLKPEPLYPIPVVSQPFEHLTIDCVGPLPCSKAGYIYLLTVMCPVTHYPAAYPLHTITTKSIVRALTRFISVFRISQIIKSDQGSNYTFAQVLSQLRIRQSCDRISCTESGSPGAVPSDLEVVVACLLH